MALYVGGTSLLLRGEGADGSTVFTDETGKIVTAYGNARISTAQRKFGGSSMYFDGSTSYLVVPNNIGFDFSATDFTLEAWVVLGTGGTLFSKDGQGNSTVPQWLVDVRNNGIFMYFGNGTGTSPSQYVPHLTSISASEWHHVAVCMYAGVVSSFVDGTLVSSTPVTAAITAGTKPLYIGWQQDQPTTGRFSGYLDELRITKGVALYTTDFTPPTAPLAVIPGRQVSIQSLSPYGPPLAKYDPSQPKPVMQAITTDLTDRLPYGIPNMPFSNNINLWEFKGRGRVTGTVFEKAMPANSPLRRLVRLHREPDGAFVKATWSDAVTGEYVFDGVPPHYRYFVTSFDYSGTYRAVIADNIIPDQI